MDVALAAPPSPIVVASGETDATVYVAACCDCRTCGRIFGALSRRAKPAEAPDEDTVRAAFVALLASLGCAVGQRVQCSYCASAGGRDGRDMRSWELRTVPDHLPPSRGGWLNWAGEEAEDDGEPG